ncbi:MAG: hypothetical protein NZ480_08490, partial [Bdellovibrionaceae bacterium]|nr:hypothetical protein [Pseudobdellovibrionaceae bacterium]
KGVGEHLDNGSVASLNNNKPHASFDASFASFIHHLRTKDVVASAEALHRAFTILNSGDPTLLSENQKQNENFIRKLIQDSVFVLLGSPKIQMKSATYIKLKELEQAF